MALLFHGLYMKATATIHIILSLLCGEQKRHNPPHVNQSGSLETDACNLVIIQLLTATRPGNTLRAFSAKPPDPPILVPHCCRVFGNFGGQRVAERSKQQTPMKVAGNAALTINTSTLSGNYASSFGGGIYNQSFPGPPANSGSATVAVSNCTLSSNSATSSGGGIYSSVADICNATLTVSNSTLSGNSAVNGAGIYNEVFAHFAVGPGSATLTIGNSTLSGNSASSFGGGIYNHADSGSPSPARVLITNSSLSGHSASDGAGIYNVAELAGRATLTMGETIFNAGASGANISNNSGTVTSLGYNLTSDDASAFLNPSGDQNSTVPLL